VTHPTLPALFDYWLGDHADPDAIEDHQFGCDACSERLGWIAALANGVPEAMRRRGGVRLFLTASMAARLEREGVTLRQYRPARNADVACTVAMDDDLSVSWLVADPAPGERVDVETTYPDGTRVRAEDVPFEPALGLLVGAVPSESLRPLPACVLQIRVLAVGPGGERVLSAHAYRHTPLSST
jgi:hypothetical protein